MGLFTAVVLFIFVILISWSRLELKRHSLTKFWQALSLDLQLILCYYGQHRKYFSLNDAQRQKRFK